MKKFVIERHIPGLGKFSAEQLQALARSSCLVVSQTDKPCHWLQSYVTGDKLYCIHFAESEAVIREHAQKGGFLITSIAEVKDIIDPATSNPLQ